MNNQTIKTADSGKLSFNDKTPISLQTVTHLCKANMKKNMFRLKYSSLKGFSYHPHF